MAGTCCFVALSPLDQKTVLYHNPNGTWHVMPEREKDLPGAVADGLASGKAVLSFVTSGVSMSSSFRSATFFNGSEFQSYQHLRTAVEEALLAKHRWETKGSPSLGSSSPSPSDATELESVTSADGAGMGVIYLRLDSGFAILTSETLAGSRSGTLAGSVKVLMGVIGKHVVCRLAGSADKWSIVPTGTKASALANLLHDGGLERAPAGTVTLEGSAELRVEGQSRVLGRNAYTFAGRRRSIGDLMTALQAGTARINKKRCSTKAVADAVAEAVPRATKRAKRCTGTVNSATMSKFSKIPCNADIKMAGNEATVRPDRSVASGNQSFAEIHLWAIQYRVYDTNWNRELSVRLAGTSRWLSLGKFLGESPSPPGTPERGDVRPQTTRKMASWHLAT